MQSSIANLILHQSYLHLFSYGLVLTVVFVALVDAFLIGQLKRALRRESNRLRQGDLEPTDLAIMMHPAACARRASSQSSFVTHAAEVRRKADLAEAGLFAPLRARMSLTRDLSTLMGLIATLLALVAAASDFARNGKPELLVGSVGTGCIATCIAAIGCAMALWNVSRLTRLRVQTATETEQILAEEVESPKRVLLEEVPIQHVCA
jgi:hypothetical protein